MAVHNNRRKPAKTRAWKNKKQPRGAVMASSKHIRRHGQSPRKQDDKRNTAKETNTRQRYATKP